MKHGEKMAVGAEKFSNGNSDGKRSAERPLPSWTDDLI